ncbi:Uncharacterised protein [uncultured archaeon]|nr:Uncharacterised protein [uncultured archaeon]
MNVRLIQRTHVLSPAPVLNPCRVDAFNSVSLVRPHHPGSVSRSFLDIPFFQVAHYEPVISQHKIPTHIKDRGCTHLFMGMTRFHWRYCSLKDCCISHFCIIIALDIHRRHGIPAPAVGEIGFLCHPFVAVLRAHHPSCVHFCAGYMGMRVNTSRHHGFTFRINYFCIPQTCSCEVFYDRSIFDKNIFYFPINFI